MKKFILGALVSLLALNVNAALINIYESNSSISSIAQSQAVIDSASSADTSIDSNNIFFDDRDLYGADAFPDSHNTTFVLTATGMLDTSIYSALSFYHDDGMTVSLGGNSLYTYDGNTGYRYSELLTIADTGMTSFDLLFWENYGGATLLTYGTLRSTGVTEVANIITVPAPAPLALLSLALMGFAVSRRKAKK